MPPSRRKPTQPIRHPRVAGRHAPMKPRPADSDTEKEESQSEIQDTRPEVSEPAGKAIKLGKAIKPGVDRESEKAVAPPLAEPVPKSEDKPAKPKPSPQPKNKAGRVSAVAGEPPAVADAPSSDDATSESGSVGTATDTATALARRKYWMAAAALVVVAGLLVWLAVYFKTEQNEANAATSNVASLDVAKTSQIKQDIDAAVETLFSYNYSDIAKTENAAKDLLVTDSVRAKYEKQFSEVKRLAPEQKIIVTCKVVRSAVVLADGNRARVLVFIDQTSLRTAGGEQALVSGAQLGVTAELRDGKWKVADLDDYNNGQLAAPQSSPAPGSSSPTQPVLPIPTQ